MSTRQEQLEALPGGTWEWFGKCGNDLLEHMMGLAIPAMQPKPLASRVTKQPVEDNSNMGVTAKQAHTGQVSNPMAPDATTGITPTLVTLTPFISQEQPLSQIILQTPWTHLPHEHSLLGRQHQSGLASNPYAGYLNLGSSSPAYYSSFNGSFSSPIPHTLFFTPLQHLQQPRLMPPALDSHPAPSEGI